jgi:FkbM family methyltransferase
MQLSDRTLPIAHALRRAYQAFPVRGWDHIFRFLFEPNKQRHFEFEIPLFEGIFVGHADNWIDWYALFHGCYEREELVLMRQLLSQMSHPVVLDIGANVGHHSVALAGVAGHVHAFEPYPPRLESLRANVTRNSHLRITLHPIALGNEDCEAPFRLPVTGEWAGVQFDPRGPFRLPMLQADNYLQQQKIDRVDLIKIDVDGNEQDVLRGLSSCIQNCKPIIVIEANDGIAPLRALLPEYRFDSEHGANAFCFPIV